MLHRVFKKTTMVGFLAIGMVLSAAGMGSAACLTEFMLTAGDPIDQAEFGRSVATDGNLVVVGSPEGSDDIGVGPGAAYVFRRSGTVYVQEAKLVAPDPEIGAEFGRDVEVKRNTIVVGARFASNGIVQRSGAAYVYRKKGGRWVFLQKVVASNGSPEDNFGRAVALGDSRLVVSSRKMDLTGENEGATYVFHKKNGLWQEEAVLTAGDGTDNARFGQSVAVRGSLIFIGARDADTPASQKAGAVYLFRRTHDQWEEIAKLSAGDGRKGDQFGFNIDVAGDVLAVGARRADPNGLEDAGAVYLYGHVGDAWEEIARLTAPDAESGDEFGHSVGMRRGRVAVGARRADIDGFQNQGAVYLFRGFGSRWQAVSKLTASNGAAGDEFGHSLAVHGPKIVVGANFADFDDIDQGAAYVFQK